MTVYENFFVDEDKVRLRTIDYLDLHLTCEQYYSVKDRTLISCRTGGQLVKRNTSWHTGPY